MNARPWLRLYREVLTDRKIARIIKATGQPKAVIIGFWATLLCLAAGSDRPGVLWLGADIPLTYEDLADESGLDVALVQTLVEEMIALQMLTREADGTLLITHWQERQFDSDISTPRVQRSRQRRTSPESAADETLYATHHGPGETFHVMRPTDETFHATHPGEDETFRVTHPGEDETFHVTRFAESAESETLENQNQIQNQNQNQKQNQTTTAESEQHQTQTKRRVAAVVAVDNSVDMSAGDVDNSAGGVNPHAQDGPVAGDESAERGDKRVDRVVMTRAQAPPGEGAVWPAGGDAARHPARGAAASGHDARAAPHADAHAAVDAVWLAAEAEYEARAAAESAHDARAAPDADRRAAGDAPSEDRAGQVQARLRDLATTWDANRARAREQLLALGVEADTAEHLARHYHPERVLAWCAYARRQAGLHNPAGFVVQRIMRGLPPPAEAEMPEKRWYTDEEYERFFAKGADDD